MIISWCRKQGQVIGIKQFHELWRTNNFLVQCWGNLHCEKWCGLLWIDVYHSFQSSHYCQDMSKCLVILMDRKFWAPSPLDTLDGDTTVVQIYHYIVGLFHFLYFSLNIAFIGHMQSMLGSKGHSKAAQ